MKRKLEPDLVGLLASQFGRIALSHVRYLFIHWGHVEPVHRVKLAKWMFGNLNLRQLHVKGSTQNPYLHACSIESVIAEGHSLDGWNLSEREVLHLMSHSKKLKFVNCRLPPVQESLKSPVKSLAIYYCTVSDTILSSLRVQELDIQSSRKQPSILTPRFLQDLHAQNLRSLTLREGDFDNQVTATIVKACPQLQFIDFATSKLTDQGLAQVLSLNHLISLTLRRCPITADLLKTVPPSLRQLNLYSCNKVEIEKLETLKHSKLESILIYAVNPKFLADAIPPGFSSPDQRSRTRQALQPIRLKFIQREDPDTFVQLP